MRPPKELADGQISLKDMETKEVDEILTNGNDLPLFKFIRDDGSFEILIAKEIRDLPPEIRSGDSEPTPNEKIESDSEPLHFLQLWTPNDWKKSKKPSFYYLKKSISWCISIDFILSNMWVDPENLFFTGRYYRNVVRIPVVENSTVFGNEVKIRYSEKIDYAHPWLEDPVPEDRDMYPTLYSKTFKEDDWYLCLSCGIFCEDGSIESYLNATTGDLYSWGCKDGGYNGEWGVMPYPAVTGLNKETVQTIINLSEDDTDLLQVLGTIKQSRRAY